MFHTSVTQTWYADDAGAGSTFGGIRRNLDNLMVRTPPRGYFLDPTKSILVVPPWNVPRADDFFRRYGICIVTGSCYLRGFGGSKAA